jgi:putative two-component system response regulator
MSKSVLVVEDDISYGNMLKEALEHYKFLVFLVFSSTSALDLIKKKRVDIVLSDINMPGINGINLTKRLREMYLDIPIVLMTGIHDLSLVSDALENGASDYLFKPIKSEVLPIVIERNLARRKLESKRLQENRAEILFKALKALMRALEAKDTYSSGHSHRVANLAMLVAEELNLKDEDRYTLQLAAFMHDIGKIGMPDSILKKAASLEDYELRKAKAHPVIGSKIIGEIEELSEVASIIRHHHESYDGEGYPDGLKGEAIPLFSRILAILDAYEALVSDRVYRKAVDDQKALKVIKKSAGSQFDPFLVEIFYQVINRAKNSSKDFQEEISAKSDSISQNNPDDNK